MKRNKALNLRKTEQQKLFIDTLRHDGRGGKTCRLVLLDGETVEYPRASRSSSRLVSYVPAGNTYVSVNSFKNGTRTEQNMYNIGAMYIDLDGHSIPKKNLDEAIKNTKCLIREAEQNKELCVSTMKTMTGGGIGLFFVLEKSIPVFENAEKGIKSFDAVYWMLCERIEQILTESGMLTLHVDMSVRDHTRVCRLPGTYNFNADAWCNLYECYGDTYSLEEIVCGCQLDFKFSDKRSEKTEKRKKNQKRTVISPAMLKKREENLRQLQGLRSDWTGSRENLCFIYYNCLYLMDASAAEQLLYKFNDNFSRPLPEKELKNIIREINKKKDIYHYSDRKIADILSLSKSEREQCGFTGESERQKTRRQNIQNRMERDKIAVQMILQGTPYEEVAEKLKVSLSTVKRIAKRYDCGHYKGSISDDRHIDWLQLYEQKVSKNAPIKEVHVQSATVCGAEETEEDCLSGQVQAQMQQIPHILDFSDKSVKETYGMGLEFVKYIMDTIPDNTVKQDISRHMWNLRIMKDTSLQKDTLKTLNFLAQDNTYGPNIKQCAEDVLFLLHGVRNGVYRVSLHGVSISFYNPKKDTTKYPSGYHPAKSMEQIISELEEDFTQVSSVYRVLAQELTDFYYRIRSWHTQTVHVGKYNSIKKEVFDRRLDGLNAVDIARILNHAKAAKEKGARTGITFYLRELWDGACRCALR